jgi:predicted PurR-regulated permease PerM
MLPISRRPLNMPRDVSALVSGVAILLLAYLVFLMFKPFAVALVFAAVASVVFHPFQVRLERRMSKSAASAASTAMVVAVVVIPVFAVATGIVRETIDVAGTFGSGPMEKLIAQAHGQAGRLGLDLDLMIRDAAQRTAGQAGQFASRLVGDIWNVFLGLVVALIATFFCFRDGEQAVTIATQTFPFSVERNRALLSEIGHMINSNIAASLAAASIQGAVGGLAFAWLGLPAPILWGAVMAFCSVFPFVGAWLVWIPAAAALAIAGRTWDATLLVVIGLALVHPVDNVLRPAIVSRATHLNGLLVLIGLLGGVEAFGVSGLLLGPVFVTVAAALVTAGRR